METFLFCVNWIFTKIIELVVLASAFSAILAMFGVVLAVYLLSGRLS